MKRHQEEISGLKEDKKQSAGCCFQARSSLIENMQRMLVSEDVLPEQQEWNQSVDQKDSGPPNIKEEQVKLGSEDEEKPQSSQLHQRLRRGDTDTEEELLTSNSTHHTTLKIEANGGSEPASNSDMQQLLLIKEGIISEHHMVSLNLDQKDIKEEQEQLWISQQGPQLHQLEEADTMFCFTAVTVKSENDDETPPSLQVHRSQSDESTEIEPAASSSTVHRTLTTEADGDSCEGPQPTTNSDLCSHLQPYSKVGVQTVLK
ncbi:uncharacterized protein LOC117507626 [Thalassophryne amazonica]|uniref:uncharacterized protein LOC117507626 n=1 Tax=Thalassophryne amazonica TaxID=390379 RepID=UPI001470A9C4|nr:uncharacterized protein LOC117507626 [Thalassophryne amazonica]